MLNRLPSAMANDTSERPLSHKNNNNNNNKTCGQLWVGVNKNKKIKIDEYRNF